jgi:transposase
MGALGPERIAVEATGGFETVVAAALAGASPPVVVINPAQVRHFTGRDRWGNRRLRARIARMAREGGAPRVRSWRGVEITARTLIAELPELGTLDGKRIAGLAGLAPFTRQSGLWKGKAMIAGGAKSVRSALFLASLAACRHNPVLKAFRQRLIDAGKPKMLVAIAAARKLLTILNAVLRDKQPWRPEIA